MSFTGRRKKEKSKNGEVKTVALAGNPNVGKSTLFNTLTGMNQHTGNWAGKTVEVAEGRCASEKYGYRTVDIPGTYSLLSHSPEEEIARNFICFGGADAVVVVCDASALERNLNLALQVIEASKKCIVCVNFLDEAERRGIRIDLKRLQCLLGVRVVGVDAKRKSSAAALLSALDEEIDNDAAAPVSVRFSEDNEAIIAMVEGLLSEVELGGVPRRFAALRLIGGDEKFHLELMERLGIDFDSDERFAREILTAREKFSASGEDSSLLCVRAAERIARECIEVKNSAGATLDRRLDRVLTGKVTAYPIMLLLLGLVFWLTIFAANYPSSLLSSFFGFLEGKLTQLFTFLGASEVLHGAVVLGMFRMLSWVVAVMLPPMAIFFPLFTLLEDSGYLPRIAYNLDRPFCAVGGCGKQALTMCMGFGCNAAGVTGARIIDSERERLIAILTNVFVPCNGRFPAMISVLTIFFAGAAGALSSLAAAGLLMLCVAAGVLATFLSTHVLSKTLLRGTPSSYTLELPPYRIPRLGKVIVRSLVDRTLKVLLRAVAVALPAGLLLWILANVTLGQSSLLLHIAAFLDPLGRLMGLDGVILIAFILGITANETVIPIMLMAYTASGALAEAPSLDALASILSSNGWTPITAVCFITFMLMHFPCSTALITVWRETGRARYALLAFLIPTLLGMALCIIINAAGALFA